MILSHLALTGPAQRPYSIHSSPSPQEQSMAIDMSLWHLFKMPIHKDKLIVNWWRGLSNIEQRAAFTALKLTYKAPSRSNKPRSKRHCSEPLQQQSKCPPLSRPIPSLRVRSRMVLTSIMIPFLPQSTLMISRARRVSSNLFAAKE